MSAEQEDFDQLRRLLKLKRHEQPPPRYFNDFSAQVIARIQTEKEVGRDSVLAPLFNAAPWMRQLFGAFENKPAVAWAFGMAVCALVIGGIVYSEKVDGTPVVILHAPNQSGDDKSALAATTIELGPPSTAPALAVTASTNVATQPGNSLFDQIQPQTQPVSFQPAGH